MAPALIQMREPFLFAPVSARIGAVGLGRGQFILLPAFFMPFCRGKAFDSQRRKRRTVLENLQMALRHRPLPVNRIFASPEQKSKFYGGTSNEKLAGIQEFQENRKR